MNIKIDKIKFIIYKDIIFLSDKISKKNNIIYNNFL